MELFIHYFCTAFSFILLARWRYKVLMAIKPSDNNNNNVCDAVFLALIDRSIFFFFEGWRHLLGIQ